MTTHDGDDERDPHLLAALHNAPDRDLAPTALLSAAILAEARQAVRAAAPPPSRWRAWQAAIDRLWQPAPMAAFGTLAMAAVIGVIWQGRELPDTTPGLRPERAATPSPPLLPQSSTSSTAQAPNGAAERAAKAAANEAPAPAPAARARSDTPANAAPQSRVVQGAEARSAQDAAPPPASLPRPRPWPAQAAEPTAAARADSTGERREALGKALADAARPPPGASAEAQSGRLAAAAAPTPIAPLASAAAALDAALLSDPARAQWRLTPQRVFAHDGERRAWWAALQSATDGRWQAAAGSAASVALTLLIDGAPGGSLGFEPQAVVWTDASGSAWRARLGAAELRALQEPLARW